MADLKNIFKTIGVSFMGALTASLNSSPVQMFNIVAPALRINSQTNLNAQSLMVDRIKSVGLLLSREKLCESKEMVKIRRLKNAKKRDSFEKLVRLYSDKDFKNHFRMNRKSAEIVIALIGPYVKEGTRRPAIKVQKIVLLALWILGNQESFQGVASRFKMGKGHAHRVFFTFCTILCKRAHEVIVWPRKEEATETVNKFNQLQPFCIPNVVGCLGATHIPIRSPENEDNANFQNAYGYHSTILQGICDSELRFLDVFCGWPGSSDYARVWKNSPIYEKLAENESTLPPSCHILGDNSYPLDLFLMVPFKDDGCLSDCEQHFNDELLLTRVLINQAFSILKGRFRRLKFLDMTLIHKISSVVMAACVLHNICIDNKDTTAEREDEVYASMNFELEVTKKGLEKRYEIAAKMFEESGEFEDDYV